MSLDFNTVARYTLAVIAGAITSWLVWVLLPYIFLLIAALLALAAGAAVGMVTKGAGYDALVSIAARLIPAKKAA